MNVYGTKNVPFRFGNGTIYITVLICDVAITLLSTNDLTEKGVTAVFGKFNPHLVIKNKKYNLDFL